MSKTSALVFEVWKHLMEQCVKHYPQEMSHWVDPLNQLFERGSLAKGILEVANGQFGKENLKLIYQELSQNLEENKLFEPCDKSILL